LRFLTKSLCQLKSPDFKHLFTAETQRRREKKVLY